MSTAHRSILTRKKIDSVESARQYLAERAKAMTDNNPYALINLSDRWGGQSRQLVPLAEEWLKNQPKETTMEKLNIHHLAALLDVKRCMPRDEDHGSRTELERRGLIQAVTKVTITKFEAWVLTAKGRAWLSMLLQTPLPEPIEPAYKDPRNGNVVRIDVEE